MSTHKRCFHGEITKIFTSYPLLPRPMPYILVSENTIFPNEMQLLLIRYKMLLRIGYQSIAGGNNV